MLVCVHTLRLATRIYFLFPKVWLNTTALPKAPQSQFNSRKCDFYWNHFNTIHCSILQVLNTNKPQH